MTTSQTIKLILVTIALIFTVPTKAEPYSEAYVSKLLPNDLYVWFSKNYSRVISRSSNEDAAAHAKVVSDTTTYLLKTDPQKCVRMLSSSTYGPLRPEDWPEPYKERLIKVQRKMALNTIAKPLQPPTEAEAGAISDALTTNLAEKYGLDSLKYLTPNKEIPDIKICTAWSRYYEALVKLPTHDAGIIYRWIATP
jgi:hypothetical protein